MSESDVDGKGVSWGLVLWGLAAILVALFIFGLSGILHLAIWTLVIVIIFAAGFAGIALVMRAFGS